MSEEQNKLGYFGQFKPFFRPILQLFAGQRRTDVFVTSEDMGNCLKSPTADDVSLLREGTNTSNSAEPLEQPPQYVQVLAIQLILCVVLICLARHKMFNFIQ